MTAWFRYKRRRGYQAYAFSFAVIDLVRRMALQLWGALNFMHFKFGRRLLCCIGFLLIANYAFLLKGCGEYSKVEVIYKEPLNKPSLSARLCGDPSFELCLSASANDTRSIPLFQFYQDGKDLGTSADGKLTVAGLKPDTAYSFTVVSRDNGSHVSPQSDAVSFKTAEILTKPSLYASACGDYMKEICLTASSPVSIIAQYEFYLGKDSVGTSPNGNLKVSGLNQDTVYSFTAKSRDTLNRISPSSDTVSLKTSAALNIAISGKNQINNLSSNISAYFVAATDTTNNTNKSILYSIKETPYHSVCSMSGNDITCLIQIPENSAGYVILASGLCGNQVPDANDYVSVAAAVDKYHATATLNLDRQLFIYGAERFCFAF